MECFTNSTSSPLSIVPHASAALSAGPEKRIGDFGGTPCERFLSPVWVITEGWLCVNLLISVARVKAGLRNYDADRLETPAAAIGERGLRGDIPPWRWPALSSLHREDVFPGERLSALVDATEQAGSVDPHERDLLLLGVAAAAGGTLKPCFIGVTLDSLVIDNRGGWTS